MGYISENPWPLMVLFAGIAIAALALGSAKGKSVAMACLLLALGVYVLEQSLVSPAEELETEIGVMLQNFKARDLNAIAAQISDGQDNLVALAKQGLDLVDLSESFAIKDVQITMESDSTATAMVRANGEVTLRNSSGSRRVPSFWKTTWQKNGASWKLSAATRLNPVNGKELEPFSAQ